MGQSIGLLEVGFIRFSLFFAFLKALKAVLNNLCVTIAANTKLDLSLGVRPNFNPSMSGDSARFTKSYDKDDNSDRGHYKPLVVCLVSFLSLVY